MPVTGGKRQREISQRGQYAKPGVGRMYWNYRDRLVLSYVTGRKILDAGCGEGITLEKLVRRFPDADVQGIDVDPENVVICREHGLPVTQASLYELPYDDGVFDTSILLEVLEHLDHPEKAVSELARVTRPGGRILILYPVDWAMFLARAICLRFREARFDPGHVRQWNVRALGHLLWQCGMRPIARRCLPLWPPFMLHGLCVGERMD